MGFGRYVGDMESFHFEGVEILPGTGAEVSLSLGDGPTGNPRSIPVYIIHGTNPGPVLTLTAGIHGDELNGVSVVHHLIHGDDHIADTEDDAIVKEKLSGTLICVPVVNIEGMLLEQRAAPDNKDINRLFPGKKNGNQSQRIAYALFERVVKYSDYLIDLHSAPHSRTNLPHVRANFDDKDCMKLARAFGTQIILHSVGPKGSLRRTAVSEGIPTILLEAGTAHRFEMDAVYCGIEGVLNVMGKLGMIERKNRLPAVRLLVRRSKWARAESGGLLYAMVQAGDHVVKGQKIALVTDPLGAQTHTIESPRTGVIVGMALNPLIRAGDPIANIVVCSEAKWKRAQSETSPDDPEEESVDDEEALDDA